MTDSFIPSQHIFELSLTFIFLIILILWVDFRFILKFDQVYCLTVLKFFCRLISWPLKFRDICSYIHWPACVFHLIRTVNFVQSPPISLISSLQLSYTTSLGRNFSLQSYCLLITNRFPGWVQSVYCSAPLWLC